MSNTKILLSAFFLVALVQLYIPAKMVWDREDVLETGSEYKFKTAPFDPKDPFRGKYIALSFRENTVRIKNPENWTRGETIYVFLTTDKDGFAKIRSVSKVKPTTKEDMIEAKVGFVLQNGSDKLTIDYPFDRFYMEESKAKDAEQTYIWAQSDTSKITYAVVSIKKGDAVLKDVYIDGISISEIVRANQESRNK